MPVDHKTATKRKLLTVLAADVAGHSHSCAYSESSLGPHSRPSPRAVSIDPDPET